MLSINIKGGEKMSDEAEKQREQEVKLANITANQKDFQSAPWACTTRRTLKTFFECILYAAVIFLMAQCACNGCIL
jgi:hypothetical protein